MDKIQFEEIRLAFQNKHIEKIKALTATLLFHINNKDTFDLKVYYHPLGFFYSQLYGFENGESLRIHIWDKEQWVEKSSMDIHNHYYIVNSFVLCGQITNRLYKILNIIPPTHSIYEGYYSKDGDRGLKKTNKMIYAEMISQNIIRTGELYQIHTNEIHSNEVDDKLFTSTLVFTEKPGRPNPLVLGSINGADNYLFKREVVENEIARGLFRKVEMNIN